MARTTKTTTTAKRHTVKWEAEEGVWEVISPDGTVYGWEDTEEDARDDAYRLNREMEEEERQDLVDAIAGRLDGLSADVLRAMAALAGLPAA